MDGSGDRAFGEERPETKAGIPVPAIGIEDPEGGPPARWPGPAARHDDLGGLPHHVSPKPDPRLAGKLQADPGPLPDRGGHRTDEARRLQDEEGDPGPTGEGGEPAEPVGEPRRTLRPGRQVDDQEVHRPAGQERPGHRQTLVRAGRGQDHEPGGLDAAGHGLHRIEGVGEIQPGDDRPARLGLGGEPEGDGGPAAREVAAEREAHPARQAAGAEDGIQRREAGGVDAGGVRCGVGSRGSEPDAGVRLRNQCQRADHLPRGPGGGRSPARAKCRQGCRHVRGKSRHQVPSIEHMFE